jgi:hypothetical protein
MRRGRLEATSLFDLETSFMYSQSIFILGLSLSSKAIQRLCFGLECLFGGEFSRVWAMNLKMSSSNTVTLKRHILA